GDEGGEGETETEEEREAHARPGCRRVGRPEDGGEHRTRDGDGGLRAERPAHVHDAGHEKVVEESLVISREERRHHGYAREQCGAMVAKEQITDRSGQI